MSSSISEQSNSSNDGFGSAALAAALFSRRGGECNSHYHCYDKDKDWGELFMLNSLLDKADNTARDLGELKYKVAERVCDAENSIKETVSDSFRFIAKEFSDSRREATENLYKLAKQNDENTQKILDKMCANKIDEKNDEIARLRQRIVLDEIRDDNRRDFSDIKLRLAVLDSEFQSQRQGNKTIQLGAGNVAIPTNSQAQSQIG